MYKILISVVIVLMLLNSALNNSSSFEWSMLVQNIAIYKDLHFNIPYVTAFKNY